MQQREQAENPAPKEQQIRTVRATIIPVEQEVRTVRVVTVASTEERVRAVQAAVDKLGRPTCHSMS
jgi:hypothetical protein